MASKKSPDQKTVGHLIEEIAPKVWRNKRCLMWPPDAFVVCAAILQRSGAYTEILRDWPPRGTNLKARAKKMKAIGKVWAEQAAFFHELGNEGNEEELTPEIFLSVSVVKAESPADSWMAELIGWSNTINSEGQTPIDEVYKKQDLIDALMNLLAAADEACSGVGQPDSEHTPLQRHIALLMSQQLRESVAAIQDNPEACKLPATMCKNIHPSRAVALPKLHTPQSGMTLRSLSHNIAFCLANEVCPEWYSQYFGHLDHSFNVLVVPWPDKVEPSDFSACDTKDVKLELPAKFGHFIYRPRSCTKEFGAIFRKAWKIAGRIDAVFFPEGAFGSQQDFNDVVNSLLEAKTSITQAEGRQAREIGRPKGRPEGDELGEVTPEPLLVIGGVLNEKSRGAYVNQACCKTAIWNPRANRWMLSTYHQHKHHAWKLNGSQIINYGLSSRLDPTRDWWEHISLRERDSLFMALSPWLTLCVVICEDLARPDPLTELIRAVGPNLVLALLMDGPQLPQRWSGRYATVLADDPGSAVLSITSIGMAECCLPSGKAKSRTIGLWKDTYDSAQPIDLEPGAQAVVLTLAREYKEEWTADGRSDGSASGHLRLGGVLQVLPDR